MAGSGWNWNITAKSRTGTVVQDSSLIQPYCQLNDAPYCTMQNDWKCTMRHLFPHQFPPDQSWRHSPTPHWLGPPGDYPGSLSTCPTHLAMCQSQVYEIMDHGYHLSLSVSSLIKNYVLGSSLNVCGVATQKSRWFKKIQLLPGPGIS